MTKYEEKLLDIDQLLLDANNYRFQDAQDFVFADPKRFAEESVQAKALARIRDENLNPLKQSILKNGFLPFERLVVAPHDDKFLVVEGNRRLAALRWIKSDILAGAAVPDGISDAIRAIPVVVVPPDGEDDPGLKEALMGVRHVSGIKSWGGYQRALLVATLKDKYNIESSEIAQRLGMTVHEVNRRYRALKALQQMMHSENYSDMARPEMYPLFHEAVSLPAVRDWLQWDDQTCEFKSLENADQFYSLLTIPESSTEDQKEPKINSYSEVRELRLVLASPEARKVLLNPTKSFPEALAVTKRQEIVNSWKSEVAEAIEAVKGIGGYELKRLDEEDLGLLRSLKEVLTEVLHSTEAIQAI